MNEAANMSEKAVMPSREKYWEECDSPQQIERLRDTVARLCRDVTVLATAIQAMAQHSHGPNGELMGPLHIAADPRANYAQSRLGGSLYAHDDGIPHNLRTKRERRDF